MEANGLNDVDISNNVTVKFLVPYETKWGENLIVLGSRGLLGAGVIEKGIPMSCAQSPQGLMWQASIMVPEGYECTYKYVVWNEHKGAHVTEECTPHELSIPHHLAGSCVLLSDQFQVRACGKTACT
jgi:Starch binding domain